MAEMQTYVHPLIEPVQRFVLLHLRYKFLLFTLHFRISVVCIFHTIVMVIVTVELSLSL